MTGVKLGLIFVGIVGAVGVLGAFAVADVRQQNCYTHGAPLITHTPLALDGRSAKNAGPLQSCDRQRLSQTPRGRAALALHALPPNDGEVRSGAYENAVRALIAVEKNAVQVSAGGQDVAELNDWTVVDHPRTSAVDFGQPERLRLIAYLSWLNGDGETAVAQISKAERATERLKTALRDALGPLDTAMNRPDVNGIDKFNYEQRSQFLQGHLQNLERDRLRLDLTLACVSRPFAEIGKLCRALNDLDRSSVSRDNAFFDDPVAMEIFGPIISAREADARRAAKTNPSPDGKSDGRREQKLARQGICEMRRKLFNGGGPWRNTRTRCKDQKSLFGAGVNVSLDPPKALRGKAADAWIVEQGRLGELESRIRGGAHCDIRQQIWFGKQCTDDKSAKVFAAATGEIAERYQAERQKNMRWWARRIVEKKGSESGREREARRRFFKLVPNAQQMLDEERRQMRADQPGFIAKLKRWLSA